MTATSKDPARALLFYLPGGSPSLPPSARSSVWDLGDNGAWKSKVQYPVYTIPSSVGSDLIHELSLYSGNLTTVPFGHQISEIPGIDPRDYVRMYAALTTSNSSTLPSFWVFLLIVLAVMVLIVGSISALMHIILRSRRKSLQQRVASGSVNLEALGIKRLTIPPHFIERLPLFIYNCESEKSPPTCLQQRSNTAIGISWQGATPGADENRSQDDEVKASRETPSQVLLSIVDGNAPYADLILVHKFLPYSQPTCPICREDFQSGMTEIRELPCGHIFHPECIDTFLANNSSLCPVCKQSVLPVGYCPVSITNAMVRRERNLRRLRSRVVVDEGELDSSGARSPIHQLGAIIKPKLFSSPYDTAETTLPPTVMPLQPQAALMTSANNLAHRENAAEPTRQELIQHRVRELAAGQPPIRDPDAMEERRRPKCR